MKKPDEMHKKGILCTTTSFSTWDSFAELILQRNPMYYDPSDLRFRFSREWRLVFGQGKNISVQNAYELRMQGKVDEALNILNDLVAKDSTNAMAHYEIARTQTYMMVAQANVSMDKIVYSINKAVSCDPKNVIYAYYKALTSFLQSFMSMQQDQQNIKKHVEETCTEFEHVLKLKPDYYEAMLYLIDMYGMLPGDMEETAFKAAGLVTTLVKMNAYYGAKARIAVSPEGTDKVKFWSTQLKSDPGNANILAELCKACLLNEDIDQAILYSSQAIKLDNSKNILLLDLARYHIYKVMQNKDLATTELPRAKEQLKTYLVNKPEPIVPLKAYTLGWLANIEMFSGNKADSEKLIEEAKAADPYFSHATGIPMLVLFDRPDELSHHYFSFFSPF